MNNTLRNFVHHVLQEQQGVIKSFTRLEGGYPDTIELFLIVLDGSPAVVELVFSSSLAINLRAKGPNSHTVYRGLIDRYQQVERLEITATTPDEDARKHLGSVLRPGPFQLSNSPQRQSQHMMYDFHKLFARELSDWKGSFSRVRQGENKITFTRHPFWSTFVSMVRQQLPERIVLYRGIYGVLVNRVQRTGVLPVHRYSSWSDNEDDAYLITDWGDEGSLWMVVLKEFSSQDVVLAPVELPEYEPSPRILIEHLQTEGEHIVDSANGSLKVDAVDHGIIGEDR